MILSGLLARASIIPVSSERYEFAASLYRTCRQSGATVRPLIDCLIAAAAIAAGTPVLHADTDFDLLARHPALEVVTLG